jgi:hypothetical protein
MGDHEREARRRTVVAIDSSAEHHGVDSIAMALKNLRRKFAFLKGRSGALFVLERDLIKQNPHGKHLR